MKVLIEVEITNLKVDSRYYFFDYRITRDGKLWEEGSYENDYENGMTAKEWRICLLKDGLAVQYALEQIF